MSNSELWPYSSKLVIDHAMDLDARPYRAFVRVADSGSFSRAADSLNISQPALSAQIRELERRLGFMLFSRTSRRVDLTIEGSLFLDKARRLVIETDWLNQAAREIRLNQLRIGAAHHSAQIAERRLLIDRFTVENSGIPLQIIGRTHAQLFSDLARNDIDVAITIELSSPDIPPSAIETHSHGEYDRLILGERPIRLLRPRSDSTGAVTDPSLDSLRGVEVGIISRAHGVALTEAIARRLTAAGAILWHPPEGDALSVLRYAGLLKRPAIDLGWFGDPPLSLQPFDESGLDLRTALVALTHRRPQRKGAERFLDTARQAFHS